jgi:hypothetical protein
MGTAASLSYADLIACSLSAIERAALAATSPALSSLVAVSRSLCALASRVLPIAVLAVT